MLGSVVRFRTHATPQVLRAGCRAPPTLNKGDSTLARPHAALSLPLAPILALNAIALAPLIVGVRYGPCLLEMSRDDWVIGSWDGESWYCADGFPVAPRYYAELPTI